jgi:hypothetical protein
VPMPPFVIIAHRRDGELVGRTAGEVVSASGPAVPRHDRTARAARTARS